MAKKRKTAATKDSVLRRQKPKRTPKKRRVVILRRTFLAMGAALLVAMVGMFLYGGQKLTAVVSNWLSEPTEWRISLRLEGDKPLAEGAAAGIIATAQKSLGSGSSVELAQTAALVQKQAAFTTVHFFKAAPDHMILSLKQRHPVLCVEADKLRYVGTDDAENAPETAVVYGDARDATCPGPLLTGVFERDRVMTFNPDYTVVLSPEETEAVQEAVQLVQDAALFKYPLASIEYRSFRGFFVVLADGETEVALGRAPFATKLEKLGEVMGKLSRKGEVASRIELDYQGKAFIKKKKM